MSVQTAVERVRGRRFGYAVASSLASKVTTVAVQVVALPIAAASVGTHQFALYLMLTAAAGWLSLSNLGIGPTLVVRVATLRAQKEHEIEKVVFSSAFFLTLIVSAGVTVGAIAAIWTLPVQSLFGPVFAPDLKIIRWGLSAVSLIFFAQSLLSLFESAQAGYQEQYLSNLVTAAGSVPSILCLLAVSSASPSPVELIVALNVPLLLFRTGNAVSIMCRHPATQPSLRALRWSACRSLIKDGAIYSMAGGAGSFFAHVLPVILVGRAFEAELSAAFAVTMNGIILASGVITMVATPLWPAVADSVARGDLAWARKAYQRLVRAVMGFGIATAMFLAVSGDWVFRAWFNGQITPSDDLILAASFYFVALCWEAAHFSVLVGLHRIGIAALLVCIRAACGIVVMLIWFDLGSEAMPFIVMSMSVIVVSAIPLRLLALRALRTPT